MSVKTHEHWASRLGFILASVGSAVGLGSFWRFPYITGTSGGGAFVILYLALTFLLGLPIFMGELLIGRRAQRSSVNAYNVLLNRLSNWSILGWFNCLTCLIIVSYYSVVSGWCLSYIFMSLNQFFVGKTDMQIKEIFHFLVQSPGMNLLWFGLFLAINAGILYSGIRKGIEHWSKILMPALFVILLGLFFYTMTLPGFGEAVRFIFAPNFQSVTGSVVLNALGMAFFTFSVGMGIIVTYGSYMQKTENIPKNGALIALATVFVSIMAALIIFPIVFSYNLPPAAGPGLIFQTMPILFAKLPAGILISTVFFALLLFAALTSTISLLEVLVANAIDVWGWSRGQAVLLVNLLVFVVGIPSALSGSNILFPEWTAIYGKSFFDTMDYITASWFIPIGGLSTTIFLGWVLHKNASQEELVQGSLNKWIAKPWFFMIRWVAPAVVLLIILQETGLVRV